MTEAQLIHEGWKRWYDPQHATLSLADLIEACQREAAKRAIVLDSR